MMGATESKAGTLTDPVAQPSQYIDFTSVLCYYFRVCTVVLLPSSGTLFFTTWRKFMQKRIRGSANVALIVVLVLVGLLFLIGWSSYNGNVGRDETTKAAWSEVVNQYKRRADLIPSIVATVKGEANFEQETLTRVIEARAKATSIQVTPELANDPNAMKRFQSAQGELGGALSRLMVVSERYPELKANAAFRDLRVQLEGTENRITVARNRYIKAVADYNVGLRAFPSNLFAGLGGFQVKPNFQVENEAAIQSAPSVDFQKK